MARHMTRSQAARRTGGLDNEEGSPNVVRGVMSSFQPRLKRASAAKESRGVTVLVSLKFLSLDRPAIWPLSEVQIDSGPK